jgi:integrase
VTETLQKAVKAAAQRAGLRKAVNCHALRHPFGLIFSRNGADIRSVQELLGHASLETTMIYTHGGQAAWSRWREKSVGSIVESLCKVRPQRARFRNPAMKPLRGRE